MKKRALYALSLLMIALNLSAQKNVTELKPIIENNFNFIVATDLGRNGYYDQKKIADLMGTTAENIDIEFVIASGDTHHYMGVQSTTDPLWMTNFELIYKHPELQIPWYPVLGNHEYQGNTQAVIDYSNVSRRWMMPSRYYTQSYKIDRNNSLRIVYVDTAPLIDKYRKDSKKYPDAGKQSMVDQLAWVDSTLNKATENWKIVVGHHPIYAETSKTISERTDLQERLDPILKENKVNAYISGHIHNFQMIRPNKSTIDYITNSSGSKSRSVKPIEGTLFSSGETGFIIASFDSKNMTFYFINGEGEIIYTLKK